MACFYRDAACPRTEVERWWEQWGGQVPDAGGHSGHARSTESCCGASSLARAGLWGAGGTGGSGAVNGCGFLATGSGMPLIVQPQSEHDVSAGTSARMNSWPFCLHARCPRAGHTQTLAHASQCVAAERVSTKYLRAPRPGVLDLEATRNYLPIPSESNLCTQLYILHTANSV